MASVTERSRKSREKQRKDPEKVASNREKDKLRKRYERELLKNSMTLEQREVVKTKERERKRRQKEKKASPNLATPSAKLSPYTDNRTLGKAISRAKTTLPRSPTREATVLGTLVDKLTPTKRKIVFEHVTDPRAKRKLLVEDRHKRNDAIPQETVEKVQNFYQQDYVSRMCPGKKDCVTVRENGEAVKHQKRQLLLNISEAHQLFCTEHPDLQIGLTKFGEFRPKFVVPMTNRSQDVCLCKYHENVSMLAPGLRNIASTLPSNSEDIVKESMCDMNEEVCVNRMCENCGVSMLDEHFSEENANVEVRYYQWATVDGRVTKQLVTTTQAKAVEELYSQLQKFSRHVYDARRQHYEMRQLKADLTPGEIILHEDFSENYLIKHQNEIMSAHWSSESVTLFTAIVYYRPTEGSDLSHLSYVITSEELCHDKSAVYSFNKHILEDAQSRLPWAIEKVHYWSDGAASQFKNKYTLGNLTHHQDEFGFTADWSFFATAHGKGPIDGIGGEVKRCVWRAVLQGKEVVSSASDFYEVAKRLSQKITVLNVSASQIQSDTAHLHERWAQYRPLRGIQTCHYVRPQGEKEILMGLNSPFTCDQPLHTRELLPGPVVSVPEVLEGLNESIEQSTSSTGNAKAGDYVKIRYATRKSEKLFMGLVLLVDDHKEECEIKFMRPADLRKKVYTFPEPEDISLVDFSQVVCVLPVPEMDHRGRYTFP